MLTREFSLDMVPGSVPLHIHVSQFDSDETIIFDLFSSQGTLNIPKKNVSAVFRGTKNDGNGISKACTFAYDGDLPTVTLQLTQQITAIAGKTPFEIVLTAVDENGESFELPSATFYLIIKPAALGYDTVVSDSDISEIADVMTKADKLIASAEDIRAAAAQVAAGGYAGKDELEALQDDVKDIADDMEAVKESLKNKVQGGYLSKQSLFLVTDTSGSLGPFTGIGGGGSGTVAESTMTMKNITGWTNTTISKGTTCVVKVNWESTEDGMSTGDGSLTVTVNDSVKANINVSQGDVEVDVTDYLSVGNNLVKLNIMDSTGNVKSRSVTVNVISLYITSSFDDSSIKSGAVTFPYIPYGAVSKTVHFVIDGNEAGSTVTTVSGRQLTWTIPAQTHGAHTIEVYITATVGGTVVRSESLYYDVIWILSSSTAPVISVPFHTTEISQYSTVTVPFMAYTPGSQTSDVLIYVGDELAQTVTVDRRKHTFSKRLDVAGETIITFKSGTAERSITLTVKAQDIDVKAEEDGLKLYLSSAGRSNNEEAPGKWVYGDVECQFSNFNFTSDGWHADSDGVIALRTTGDARLTIPYKLFKTDFRSTGQTIELDFATRDVMDYDAPVISCVYGGRGLTITPQSCSLSSEQTTISMQYKEEEHLRVSFVVEKTGGFRRLYCYIDGIMSGCIQYATDDDFSQTTPVDITVGSNLATVDLYCIRVYENDLTSEQIKDNWIADTQDGALMIERYVRNDVYDEYGSITTAKLPNDLPYMVLECPQLPQYKGDKKTVSGRYVDPEDSSKSFTFENCEANVQGTSSQFYARKNYKLKFKGGFVMESGEIRKTYRLTSDCVDTNQFCMKADVASSEGANNVELVRLYCKACPYETPAQEENSLVRQGIDGFPIVMFWHDTVNDTTTFLGKYNFNLDKGTEECYGFEEGDESWEILNNTSDRVLWKSADYSDDGWLNDFEARYPYEDPAYTDSTQLSEFAAWVVSTDPDQATGEELAEPVTYEDREYTRDTIQYRNAKFKAELSDYVELDSALFYYLYTELFLLVDSRAKNAFPSFIGSSVEST